MKSKLKKIYIILNIPRMLPAYLLYRILRRKNAEVKKLDADIEVWKQWKNVYSMPFFYFFLFIQEFRNIVYYRLGMYKHLIKWLCPPLMPLYIRCPSIAEGFMLQHGFSSTCGAEKMGYNCRVFQQVTLGYSGNKRPELGNNVVVCSGAKIFGGIKVGNNVIVGANAVVCKDIPDNCVVGGIPAKILKRLITPDALTNVINDNFQNLVLEFTGKYNTANSKKLYFNEILYINKERCVIKGGYSEANVPSDIDTVEYDFIAQEFYVASYSEKTTWSKRLQKLTVCNNDTVNGLVALMNKNMYYK